MIRYKTSAPTSLFFAVIASIPLFIALALHSAAAQEPDGDVTTIDYSIRQRNKDKWNYLLGFNWDINKNWSISAESGFGGSRDNMIALATFRF
jgi:hypothetical protein